MRVHLAAVLPTHFLLADIRAFAVNVPFMDDRQFVRLLEKGQEWNLKFPRASAWAMNFRRRILYRLPDGQKFVVISSEEAAAQEADRTRH
jgi:hypothetical protein